jgi:hypothetical protein
MFNNIQSNLYIINKKVTENENNGKQISQKYIDKN